MPVPLTGEVLLPPDAPSTTAALVRIEIRDTSLADAPSTLVAETVLRGVPIGPGGRIPFRIEAGLPPGRALTLRVHISLDGAPATKLGDLLTMESVPVPEGLGRVPVRVVR